MNVRLQFSLLRFLVVFGILVAAIGLWSKGWIADGCRHGDVIINPRRFFVVVPMSDGEARRLILKNVRKANPNVRLNSNELDIVWQPNSNDAFIYAPSYCRFRYGLFGYHRDYDDLEAQRWNLAISHAVESTFGREKGR